MCHNSSSCVCAPSSRVCIGLAEAGARRGESLLILSSHMPPFASFRPGKKKAWRPSIRCSCQYKPVQNNRLWVPPSQSKRKLGLDGHHRPPPMNLSHRRSRCRRRSRHRSQIPSIQGRLRGRGTAKVSTHHFDKVLGGVVSLQLVAKESEGIEAWW